MLTTSKNSQIAILERQEGVMEDSWNENDGMNHETQVEETGMEMEIGIETFDIKVNQDQGQLDPPSFTIAVTFSGERQPFKVQRSYPDFIALDTYMRNSEKFGQQMKGLPVLPTVSEDCRMNDSLFDHYLEMMRSHLGTESLWQCRRLLCFLDDGMCTPSLRDCHLALMTRKLSELTMTYRMASMKLYNTEGMLNSIMQRLQYLEEQLPDHGHGSGSLSSPGPVRTGDSGDTSDLGNSGRGEMGDMGEMGDRRAAEGEGAQSAMSTPRRDPDEASQPDQPPVDALEPALSSGAQEMLDRDPADDAEGGADGQVEGVANGEVANREEEGDGVDGGEVARALEGDEDPSEIVLERVSPAPSPPLVCTYLQSTLLPQELIPANEAADDKDSSIESVISLLWPREAQSTYRNSSAAYISEVRHGHGR